MEKNTKSRDGFLFLMKFLAVAAILFLSVFAGVTLFRFSTDNALTWWLCLIPAGAILLLIPVLFVRKKLRYLLIWFALCLTVCIPAAITLQDEYIDSITVDTDPALNVEPYLPFQTEYDSYYNIWRLGFWDEYRPLEVELTEDLPVLDGSEYAFRLYSAVVNALYPETTELNGEYFRFSGSEEAFAALLNGEVDIWFGFEPTQAQLDAAAAQGVELEITPVAVHYWYFIVNRNNPVWSLTEDQIKGIFSGEITNWSQVGGNDEPILVYQNESGSVPQQLLEQFMDGTPLTAPIMERSDSQQQVAKYRNYSNAVGFTLDGLTSTVRSLLVLEDSANYMESDHSVPIFAVTRKDTDNENVEAVLDFLTSVEGQYMAMHAGYGHYYYNSFYDTDKDDNVVNTAPNIVLEDYMPFRDVTKIVKLDHEASLKLQDGLPRIDGAAAVFPVYSAFVDAVYPPSTRLYNNDSRSLEELPRIYFFNYSNTVKGYQYLAQKDTDIFFGGYPSDEQIAYAEENDTEFVYTPIAYDAFVFFVHKDNPIDSLTTEQIQGIYSGEITNWSQVGGHDEEIVAYQRNEGSGSQSRLIRFMDGKPLMEAPIDATIDTMMGITVNVAGYRSSTASIGFSFRYYMEVLVANPDIKLLSVDGIAPSVKNIQNGTYPLTGYLYAVTWEGNENENVQKLLDWVLSPEGQYIIAETGYVPIGPTE